MPEDDVVRVYYVKAWKSGRDREKGVPPRVHYVYHSGEGAALELNLNVRVRFDTISELRDSLRARFAELEYGFAPPDEWEEALGRHRKEYGEALEEMAGRASPNVVVRRGGRRGRRGGEKG